MYKRRGCKISEFPIRRKSIPAQISFSRANFPRTKPHSRSLIEESDRQTGRPTCQTHLEISMLVGRSVCRWVREDP